MIYTAVQVFGNDGQHDFFQELVVLAAERGGTKIREVIVVEVEIGRQGILGWGDGGWNFRQRRRRLRSCGGRRGWLVNRLGR